MHTVLLRESWKFLSWEYTLSFQNVHEEQILLTERLSFHLPIYALGTSKIFKN